MGKKLAINIEAMLYFDIDDFSVNEYLDTLKEVGIVKIKDVKTINEKDVDEDMNNFKKKFEGKK